MGTVFGAFTALLLMFVSIQCGAEVTDAAEKAMIERGKERCADFYHRKAEDEEKDKERNKGIAAVKKERREYQDHLDAAREKYIKDRKTTKVDPKLEQEWIDQDKAWKEQNKVAARRWVKQQEEVERIQKRGCHIPGNVEYDLEDN